MNSGRWILMVAFVALMVSSAFGDIYRFEDDDGVVHFTDVPTDRRFKLFMRDLKKDIRLRTTFRLGDCARNPEEFASIINQCALEYGVDKTLVQAVIHAESGYNPNAVSRKGAAGLMQLMPATARRSVPTNCAAAVL